VTPRRFDFLHEPGFALLLRGIGVRPDTCWVEVGDETVEVRFGRWSLVTPLANVADVSVSGPYRWFKAVGIRLSMADRGVTFGTSAQGGACLRFHEPVPLLLGRRVPHPGLTVTVSDPHGLAEEVLARRDERPTG
jgi:hypothetical protein